MKAIIWGAGALASKFIKMNIMLYEYDIMAVTDNNNHKWGQKISDYVIISPDEAISLCPEVILVLSEFCYKDIIKQIQLNYGIKSNQIKTFLDLEESLVSKIITKYDKCEDKQIQRVIEYYKKDGFNIYGYYKGKRTLDYVERDEHGNPFIYYENKRMYYPIDEVFLLKDNKPYVENIEYEQGEGSPHKYVTKENEKALSGVIVDAGVREGNFALKYVEQAKKIYLIESDERWMNALKRTFEPYKEKVIFCNKFLSDYNSDTCITLDTLVDEPIDFLKMDIEGFEIAALKGAKNLLTMSNAHCAICSYHRKDDQIKIETIMKEYNYKTCTTEGYMFFPYGDEKIEECGLRRGIVYSYR